MNVENDRRVCEQASMWRKHEGTVAAPCIGVKRKAEVKGCLMVFILEVEKLALTNGNCCSEEQLSSERYSLVTFNCNVSLPSHNLPLVEERIVDSQGKYEDEQMFALSPHQERCDDFQGVYPNEGISIFNTFPETFNDSQEACQDEGLSICNPFPERCNDSPEDHQGEGIGIFNNCLQGRCNDSGDVCRDEGIRIFNSFPKRLNDSLEVCRVEAVGFLARLQGRCQYLQVVCEDEETDLFTVEMKRGNVCQRGFSYQYEEMCKLTSWTNSKRFKYGFRDVLQVEEKDADKDKQGRDRQREQSDANKHVNKERREAIGSEDDAHSAGETDKDGKENGDKESGEGDEDKGEDKGKDNVDDDEEEEAEEEEEKTRREKINDEEGISDMQSAVCTSSVPSVEQIEDTRKFLTCNMFYDDEFSKSELTISCPYQYSRRYSRRSREVNQEVDSGCKTQIFDEGISISHIQSIVVDPSGQASPNTSKDCQTDASINCNKGPTSSCESPCLHYNAGESFQASPEIYRGPSSELNTSHNEMQKLYDSTSLHASSDDSKYVSAASPKQQLQPSGIKLRIKLPREEMLQKHNVNGETMEDVMSNHNEEVTMKQLPTTAKALLSSGVLEGSRVSYQYRRNEILLTGLVKGGGILCDCKLCGGKNIVNVSSFERHAGSNARHPSDYIFLENGKSLQDVLRNGRINKKGNCIGTVRKVGCSTEGDTNSKRRRTTISAFRKKSPSSNADPLQWKVEADSTRPLHTPQSSQPRDGSRHKMLFLPGGLPDGTEVSYYVKGQCFLTGTKMGHGICCGCCNEVISCSQFEAHAGWASRRNAYISIFLSNGQSLHEFGLTLSEKHQNDRDIDISRVRNDYCADCGDSGVLIGCNVCPRAYHAECAGIPTMLEDSWCCSICESVRNQDVKNIRDCEKPITTSTREKFSQRCQRIVKASQNTIGGCVFCKNGDFLKSGFGAKTIMLCDQCEREYHVGCMKEHGVADLQELPPGEWFCCIECKSIHNTLEGFVSSGSEPVEVDILNSIAKNRCEREASYEQVIPQCQDFSWQLLHGRRGDPKNGKTLSQVAKIFSESFDPIIDATSGRDLISLMVYSQSIRDQDFRGMYCAVLTKKEEVVSAAVFRVFGSMFAEMPLVATAETHRGQGYFQILMSSIEGLLRSLQVKYLVLPAAEEAVGIWTNKFAFSKLQDTQLQQFGSEVQMMIFQGSSMLVKPL